MTAWTCRQSAGKAAQEIVPPRPRIPCWKGLGADSEETREPVSDINAGVVDSLKALDPERSIREAVVIGFLLRGPNRVPRLGLGGLPTLSVEHHVKARPERCNIVLRT
jgi:hypothetical protein